MKKKFLATFLCLVLVGITSFGTAGCTAAEFTTVLNEIGPAVGVILQIVALAKGVPVTGSLQAKVTADSAAANTLIVSLSTSATANKGSVVNEINGAFTTLEADLGSVFTLAQVSDPNTQAKLTSLIGLVQGLVQIAEAAVPAAAPVATTASARVSAPPVTSAEFINTWNATLTAKTGITKIDQWTAKNTYHRHGKFVRVLSLGAAQ